MKGIDPKYIMYLGLLVTVEQAIGHGTVSLTNLVPASWAPYITSWCNFLAFIGTSIMTYQAAISGPQTGPLVNLPPPVTPTIVKILIAAFVLSLFLPGSPVLAQTNRNTFDPLRAFEQLNEQIVAQKKAIDSLAQKQQTSVGQKISSDISSALNQFSEFVGTDTTNAANLAISIPSTLDGNGQICWDAMADASKIFQQNPVPTPDIATTLGVASTIERIRLLAMTANNVCQLPACTQVVADASGALSAAIPLKTPLPNLHDICSMIPTVAKGTPTRTLATTSPSPSPTAPQ